MRNANTDPVDPGLMERLWAGLYDKKDIEAAAKSYEDGLLNGSAFSSILFTYAKRLRAEGDEDGYRVFLGRAVEASDILAEIKEDGMTADELDVRQSILREVGRFAEAGAVIKEALGKLDEEASAPHTKALLYIGKMEALKETGAPEEAVWEAVREVEQLAKKVAKENPLQAIRVYRGLARHYKERGEAEFNQAVSQARELIRQTGAGDQELKLEYDIRGR
jgi:tetratricopeptide (TPR) repeat protein